MHKETGKNAKNIFCYNAKVNIRIIQGKKDRRGERESSVESSGALEKLQVWSFWKDAGDGHRVARQED